MTEGNGGIRREEAVTPPPERSDERIDASVDSDRVIREEVVQEPDGTQVRRVAQETTVVPSQTTLRKAQYVRVKRAVYFVVHIISIFILIRFVLLMLGANPESAFASFIYGLTAPFVAPFLGLFGAVREPQYGLNIFEMSNIVAILIYYLIAWIITGILRLVYKPKTPLEQANQQ